MARIGHLQKRRAQPPHVLRNPHHGGRVGALKHRRVNQPALPPLQMQGVLAARSTQNVLRPLLQGVPKKPPPPYKHFKHRPLALPLPPLRVVYPKPPPPLPRTYVAQQRLQPRHQLRTIVLQPDLQPFPHVRLHLRQPPARRVYYFRQKA